MDSGLVRKGLDFTKRKRKWIILLGLIGFSSYGMYRVYHMPSVARKRKRIMKLVDSLLSMAEMVSDSAETVSVVSRDLKEFLKSDSDDIPNSLKQLTKIARSEEFSESVNRVSQAMAVGILRGYKDESGSNEIQEADHSSFPDRVMDILMSTAGTGFVSIIVGSFARNLVLGFYADSDSSKRSSEHVKSTSSVWVNVVTDERCRVLVADSIKNFVSTAVAVYLDKTMNVNFYEEMFSGLTNPKHQNNVTEILVSLCNAAVETLVKTSHHVLTASQQNPESTDSYSTIDQSAALSLENKDGFEPKVYPRKVTNVTIGLQNSGWVNTVSSTLAVPSNRKLVLDVTGRVTFETVRSVVEFLLWKLSDGLKKSKNVVHDEVVERGYQVVKYFGAKSYVIFTICLALFLHIMGNTRVLLPA